MQILQTLQVAMRFEPRSYPYWFSGWRLWPHNLLTWSTAKQNLLACLQSYSFSHCSRFMAI